MILEVALDADPEWDSSIGWADLAEAAAEAAIAESRFPSACSRPAHGRAVGPPRRK